MYCIKCGNEIPDGSKFCSRCGAKTAAAERMEQPGQAQNIRYEKPIQKPLPEQNRQEKPRKSSEKGNKSGKSGNRFGIGIAVGAIAMAAVVAVLAVTNMISLNFIQGKSTAAVRYEGNGYDTPEDAVRAYLESLKAGDIDQAVSTFAVETYF